MTATSSEASSNLGKPSGGFSLYVHVPFCAHKCPYCDFNTYAVGPRVPEDEYIDALEAELTFRASQASWQGRSVQTIFFGGGSPSLFSSAGLARFLGAASSLFVIDPEAEISIEVNPRDTSLPWFSEIREAGINRVSIGAQSFTNKLLEKLGRIHSAADITKTIEDARAAGLSNVTIDLMFGIPGQTSELFERDLREALALRTNHLSLYGLTIEPGTPFFQSMKRGTLRLPAEETTVEMMALAERLLPEAGLQRYEISNYARPGSEARHNIAYWTRRDYLGLGAGAHSFCGSGEDAPPGTYGRRWSNIAHFTSYREKVIALGQAESWQETLTKENDMFEHLLLGLRMTAGINGSEWLEQYGVTLESQYGALLAMLAQEGLITWDREQHTASITVAGFRVFDSIVEQFVPDAEGV